MRRTGFTLIEMVAALTIGGIVVLLAHRVFTGVTGGAQRVVEARRALDREANARRLLADLAGSLDVDDQRTAGFDGRTDRAVFSTWLVDVNGWPEPRRVALEVRDGALMVDGLSTYGLLLADSVRSAEFDYLVDSSGVVTWVRIWRSLLSAPQAVRLRMAREGRSRTVDTLLLIVGPRG